jgi:hypothetical protein
MALLLTSVFGVTGCGSDDDVDVESRVKNIAPEASGASNGLSKADCDDLLKRQIGGGGDDDLKEQLLVVQYHWYGLAYHGDIHEDDLISDLKGRLDVDRRWKNPEPYEYDPYRRFNSQIARSDFVELLDSLDDLAHTLDALDAVDRCAVVTGSGPTSITKNKLGLSLTPTTIYGPDSDGSYDEGGSDDYDSGGSYDEGGSDDDVSVDLRILPPSVCVDDGEGVKRPFEVAVEQFREDLALFRVAQNGRNDQSLTEEQRQGHRANYSSAYDVKTKSAAAAIQVANERGFNLNSPDNLDERFLSRWDSTICE